MLIGSGKTAHSKNVDDNNKTLLVISEAEKPFRDMFYTFFLTTPTWHIGFNNARIPSLLLCWWLKT